MKKAIINITTNKGNTKFYLALGLSLLFFLQKGISYAFIGSYLPIIVISVVLLLLVWSKFKSSMFHLKVIKFWSVLLILWSLFRILMSVIIWFIKPISESHVTEQLDVFGFSLSVMGLFLGIFLFKKSKFLHKKTSSSI